MDYDAPTLAFVGLAFFVSGVVKGATGLGYATSCIPMLALVLGIKTALPLVLAPSVASNFTLLVSTGPVMPTIRRFWPMLLLAPVGVFLGAALLGSVDGATAGAALGAALIAWCAFSFRRMDWRLPPQLERPLAPAVGFSTGLVNGLTGSQVMPLAPFVMALGLAPAMLIQVMNLSFTISSAAMATALTRIGLMTVPAAVVSLAGVALSVGGVRLGSRVRRRLPETTFRRAILVVLTVAGAALIVKGLWS